MRNEDIIRAWKDQSFRESLSETERTCLPESPVGPIELREEQLAEVGGGIISLIACPVITYTLITAAFDCF